MNTPKLILLISILLLSACHQRKEASPADSELSPINWQLITTESQLSFITTKNKNITEEHSIQFSSGYINNEKQLVIKTDLTTVNTNIEIRDQRLRDLLFEVDQFPLATISTQLEQHLPLTEPFTIEFELDLHGIKQNMSAEVMIQSIGDKLVVTNYEPVLVNGKDFALDDAINQLTKIASLQSIDYSVLVDFKLTFEK